MKIALIHDWFTEYAGSEQAVEQILNCYPNADIFTLADFLPDEFRFFLNDKKVKTSFIQNLPFAEKIFRQYLLLMPFAIEQFDLSEYDLVISSSHAFAKGIITGPNQLHISYVHTPIRYAWDLQPQYLKEAGIEKGLKSFFARYILHKIRLWDYRTANGVDYFLANSNYIAARIWKTYRRDSKVIHPPVNIEMFEIKSKRDDFYLSLSRMVPYKKIGLIVEAFSKMPDKKLIVVGQGTEFKKIKKIATKNIELLGYQPFREVKKYMEAAKAFVFAAEEDFGIAPVEAQACGVPVIAYGRGGVLDSVIEGETGIFFKNQSCNDIIEAVNSFEKNFNSFDSDKIRKNAEKFSREEFRKKFKSFVDCKLEAKFNCKNN